MDGGAFNPTQRRLPLDEWLTFIRWRSDGKLEGITERSYDVFFIKRTTPRNFQIFGGFFFFLVNSDKEQWQQPADTKK